MINWRARVDDWSREIRCITCRPGRVLFNHLPKCAGSTIAAHLALHYPERLIRRIYDPTTREAMDRFRQLPESERHRYRLVYGHGIHSLLDLVHPGTLCTTVLREPVERVISHYFYVRETPRHYLHGKVNGEGISLRDYTRLGLSHELENYYITHFSGLDREEVARDPDGAVSRAEEVLLERYAIIGFQEELPAYLEQLRVRAGLRQEFTFGFRNRTRHKPAEEITPEAVEAIRESNQLDCRLYERLRTRISGSGQD